VSRRLDAAWRALDPRSRRALRTLAKAGMRDMPTALVRSAAGAPSVTQALTDLSLIVQNPETGDYRMAPLTGQHAVAQPAAAGE
jgi:hypothetical protein